jgi:hypothetical protein
METLDPPADGLEVIGDLLSVDEHGAGAGVEDRLQLGDLGVDRHGKKPLLGSAAVWARESTRIAAKATRGRHGVGLEERWPCGQRGFGREVLF